MGQISYKVSYPRSAELCAFMQASTEQRRFVAGGVRGPEVRHGVCSLLCQFRSSEKQTPEGIRSVSDILGKCLGKIKGRESRRRCDTFEK